MAATSPKSSAARLAPCAHDASRTEQIAHIVPLVVQEGERALSRQIDWRGTTRLGQVETVEFWATVKISQPQPLLSHALLQSISPATNRHTIWIHLSCLLIQGNVFLSTPFLMAKKLRRRQRWPWVVLSLSLSIIPSGGQI
jgi:hypothetical protein